VRHLDKFGVVGSIFAALCCLGVSAVVSVVSAIGLGFLINDAVLLPLLLVFLGITLAGLAMGYRRHHRPHAVALGALSGLGLLVFSFLSQSRPLAYVSIAGLVTASILNTVLHRRYSPAERQRP
jgi:mercuric ion transport protein